MPSIYWLIVNTPELIACNILLDGWLVEQFKLLIKLDWVVLVGRSIIMYVSGDLITYINTFIFWDFVGLEI